VKRLLLAASVILTLAFVILVVIPLILERFCATDQWKTIFTEYHVTDEEGKSHHGFLSLGRILVLDLQNLQYGYEPGTETVLEPWRRTAAAGLSDSNNGREFGSQPTAEMDLSPWRRTVGRGPFVPDYGREGFKWAADGILWAGPTYLGLGRRFFAEGTRYGYTIPMNTLSEMVMPGAPIDVKAENLDILGRFPEYRVRYEDDYFTFDLVYRARSKGWYYWNGGVPFQAGDFGRGVMTEVPCNIQGTIVHKRQQKIMRVTGAGVMEDATGVPWSWFDWGDHNWAAVSFPNGWSIGIWKAEDDWQWGYHRKPEEAWIWDPEAGMFHHASRVELLEAEPGYEELNDMQFLKSYHWRAYTEAGVLDLVGKQLSFNPIRRGVPYTPFTFKEAYGIGLYEGRFVRTDGTTAVLDKGVGTPEHFNALFPDMFYPCPILLLLLSLSWGGTFVAARKARGEGYRNVVIGTALACLGVLGLWWYWS
jgi:hypothetical protein